MTYVDWLAVRRNLPTPVKWAASAVLNAVDPVIVSRVRQRLGWDFPVPPRALRAHVGEPGAEFFVREGERAAAQLEGVLESVGRPLTDFRSIWDLGCGSGRVLTRLRAHPAAKLSGSDVDPAAISWLRRHYPDIDARVNDVQPRAPFEADSFDLIFVISVLTHLPEPSQDAWLAEIARLLRPGGTAVITVMEHDLLDRYRSGWRPGATNEQLELLRAADLGRDGIVFAPERITRWTRWRYPSVESTYGLAFHDAGYVRRRWVRWLEVVEILTGAVQFGQSAVVCTSADGTHTTLDDDSAVARVQRKGVA